jgi:hypothetical protein
MSGLKPIGSEKLQGMDKLRRIMEIARFNENLPQSVNETAKSEYKISLADGNTYEIVREKLGYIIKSAINESESDYIEPIRERKYFSSYSQALKRLNLMAKELNSLHENKEGISLIGEQKKKFILKTKKKKTAEPADETIPPPPVAEPTPAPVTPPPIDAEMAAPSPIDAEMGGGTPPIDAEMGGGTPPIDAEMGGMSPIDADAGSTPEDNMGGMPPEDDMGGMPPEDDMGGMSPEDDMGGMSPEDETEEPKMGKGGGISDFKRIQILVGKLAQKIRSYEDSEDLSAKDVKYIINSILSAINVEVLDEDDIEQIISKLEGTEDEDEFGGDEFGGEKDGGTEEVDTTPEDMKTPEEEMGESYDTYGEAFNDYLGSTYAKLMSDDLFEDDDYGIDDTDKIFQKYSQEREKTPSSFTSQEMKKDPYFDKSEDDMNLRRKLRGRPSNSFYHLDHGTFSESKIDKLLAKYHSVNENEIKQKYSRLVENDFQMETLKTYLVENSRVTYMGKTTKGNLVFKNGNKEIKITKSGTII